MSEQLIDRSQCSSSEDHQIPPKRRRLDMSNSSTLSPLSNDLVLSLEQELRVLKREMTSLRSRLSQTDISLKRSRQMNEWSDNQMNILKDQLQMETATTERLRQELKRKMETIHAAHAAQMAVESELSQVKTLTNGRISGLITENALLTAQEVQSTNGKIPTPSQFQKNDRETQRKLEAAEQRVIKLEEQLKENSKLQKEFNCQKMELEHAKVTIKALKAEILTCQHPKEFTTMKKRVAQLEEELFKAKEIISSQLDAEEERRLLREKICFLQKKLDQQSESFPVQKIVEVRPKVDAEQIGRDEVGKTSQEAVQVPDTTTTTIKIEPDLLLSEENSSDGFRDKERNDCNSASKANDEIIAPLETQDEDEAPLLQPSKDMTTVKLTRGQAQKARPTNPKFFELDWNKEYRHVEGQKWKCNRCSKTSTCQPYLKDHVWVAHYGEKFQCTHCTHHLLRRTSIGWHNKKKHPELVAPKDIKAKSN